MKSTRYACILCSCLLYAFSLSAQAPPANTVSVHGKITTPNGEPVPNASVTIRKTGKGAATNAEGVFDLQAPSNSTLVISSSGYIAKEVKVGATAQYSFTISLLENKNELNQVIVVGYGTRKRSDVTGAVTSISEQALREVPTANLSDALKGQGAGIDVQKDGGNSKPGATPKILVRGTRSINASNDPLFVVDGIPFNGSINDLNPDDVVAVTVLKDASSTAIYGSRGANGVVLVTTRRGRAGKPVITYSGYGGFVKNFGEYDLMNGPTFTNFKKWALINQTPGVYSGLNDPKFLTDGTFTPQEIQGINANRSTNWQKLIFHTGMMTDHQIGVSGGSETTQYSLSGGYYRETGVYEGQSFERYSFRAAVDQLLGKRVRIGISTQNSYSVTNGEIATDVSNPMGQAYRANPLVSPYDSTGKLVNAYLPGNANQVWNPLANFLPGATVETRKRFGTFTTAYVEASLAPGLKYRFNGGAELRSDVYGNFFARNTSYNQGAQSTGSNRNSFSANYTLENLLIYDKVFAQKHKINFTALYSLQESQTQTTRFDYNNILADVLQYFNPQYASNLASSKNSSPKWDIISYMGRLNYSFADKYLLTLTMRSDGSSRLAPGNKYHVFPSAAVAWNMIQEPFIAGVSALTNLKLRASYGTVGNTAIDPYKTLGALSPATYNYGTVNTTGAYLTDVPNPNLTWEYTSTLNIGLDFGLLQNRISGSVEVYQQKTHDLLLPQSLPPTSGIQNANVTNIGKTENKGIELHINTINIQSGKDNGFSWATDLNIFINRGKITQLANGVTQDINNNWFVGQPIGAIFDYKRVGVWQATPGDTALAQSLGLTTTGSGSVIGQIRVADLNGSKTIDPGDRIILGNSQPKFEGGITNRFSYKGFDFTVVAFGRYGGTLVSKMHQSGSFINTFQSNYNNLNAHYWTPTNGENYYPKPNHAQTNPPNSSLLTYFNASYLKIRSLSLGYSLPQSLIKRAGIQRIRVYATATNPFILFSPYRNKYHGLDPEVSMQSGSGTGNQAALSVDTPPTWNMIFGLNVSF